MNLPLPPKKSLKLISNLNLFFKSIYQTYFFEIFPVRTYNNAFSTFLFCTLKRKSFERDNSSLNVVVSLCRFESDNSSLNVVVSLCRFESDYSSLNVVLSSSTSNFWTNQRLSSRIMRLIVLRTKFELLNWIIFFPPSFPSLLQKTWGEMNKLRNRLKLSSKNKVRTRCVRN